MTSATIPSHAVASDMTSEIGGAENWQIVRLAGQAVAKPGRFLVGTAEEREEDSAPTGPRTIGILHGLWNAGSIKTHQAVLEPRALIETLTMWFAPEQAAHAFRALSRYSSVKVHDMLDWEAHLETAPTRPRGQIEVTLEYRGRGKPSPAVEPWA